MLFRTEVLKSPLRTALFAPKSRRSGFERLPWGHNAVSLTVRMSAEGGKRKLKPIIVNEQMPSGVPCAMRSSFDAVPIAIRIFLAGLAGCTCGFAFFVISGFTSRANAMANMPGWSLAEIGRLFLASSFYIGIAFITTLPLVSAAIVVGVSFRRKIAKQPFAWSMLAAVATWIITCAVMEFTGTPNEWAKAHSAAERFRHVLLSLDSMLVLSGSLGAGVSFYLMGLGRQSVIRRNQPASM